MLNLIRCMSSSIESNVEFYFTFFLIIQFFHSIEELSNGFHDKFPLFKMTFKFFLLFELTFFIFWISVMLIEQFPSRSHLMSFFNILMFINGWWHIVWFAIVKKYVPGLITAPLFILLFFVFYYKILSV